MFSRKIETFNRYHRTEEYKDIIHQFSRVAMKFWESTKAKTEGFFTPSCGVFPESTILSRDIISINDKTALEKSLKEALEKGFHLGVRSCFSPQIDESPWIMELDSEKSIKDFLENKYEDWKELPNITELIVMRNMPDLGNDEEKDNHFVFRIGERQSDKFKGTYIEARLGTSQLRDIESDTSRNDMIIINMKSFEEFSINIGGSYTRDGLELDYDFIENDWEDMYQDLVEIVEEKHLKTIISMLKEIKYLLRDPHLLLKRKLQAFSDFGLEYSEWQGRVSEQRNIKWMKIYGFKGSKDDTYWESAFFEKKINSV